MAKLAISLSGWLGHYTNMEHLQKSVPEETRTITVPSLSGLYTWLYFRPKQETNKLSHIYRSIVNNTVLFVNATIGFSENLFLVMWCHWSGSLVFYQVSVPMKSPQCFQWSDSRPIHWSGWTGAIRLELHLHQDHLTKISVSCFNCVCFWKNGCLAHFDLFRLSQSVCRRHFIAVCQTIMINLCLWLERRGEYFKFNLTIWYQLKYRLNLNCIMSITIHF